MENLLQRKLKFSNNNFKSRSRKLQVSVGNHSQIFNGKTQKKLTNNTSMLKAKIYEYMKKYLDAYLYDFDEDKLEMSYFSGAIELQQLHLKHDMVNKLLDSFGIPIQMKVGLIERVNVSFSLINFWNSPLEIEIEDVYLVIAPSTYFSSSDESYIAESQEDLMNTSYDSTNAFNIFDHEMKIKASGPQAGSTAQKTQQRLVEQLASVENVRYFANTPMFRERLLEEEQQVQNVRLIFNNLQLKVNRLHIRYEDDHYQKHVGKRFAFGMTIDELNIFSVNQDWLQETAKDSLNGDRRRPQGMQPGQFMRVPVDESAHPETGSDQANRLVKEAFAKNVQVYYDNQGQMIVPIDVVHAALDEGDPKKVFETVPVDLIRQKLSEVFMPPPEAIYEQQFGQQQARLNNRNNMLVVESFDCQALIFSYRAVDFDQLNNFLQSRLNDASSDSKDESTTPRQFEQIASVKKQGSNQLVNAYKHIQEQQFAFFRNEFSLKFHLTAVEGALSQNLVLNVTPQLMSALQNVNEYIENYYIAQDLKQYRPQRRPLTASQVRGLSKRTLNSESFKRKRRNLCRDWLYFIVWYVRLRRILSSYRTTSSEASVSSILKGVKIVETSGLLKSPIQDPTQLTQMEISLSFTKLQVKFFESNLKMKNFYSIMHQNRQGPNQNQNYTQSFARAMRLAPFSANITSGFMSQSSSLVQQSTTRQFAVKGVDLFLTKVNDVSKQDRRSNVLAQHSVNSTRTSKVGVMGHGGNQTGRNGQDARRGQTTNNSFLMTRQGSGIGGPGGLFKQSSGLFRSAPEEEMLEEVAQQSEIEANRLDEDMQRSAIPEEQPSVWASIFTGIKNLFNMNEDPAIAAGPSDFEYAPMNLRQSVHRTRLGEAHLTGSPSVIKGRSSFLPNAQVELKRVNQGEEEYKRDGKKDFKRALDNALSTPWNQSATGQTHSLISSQPPFQKLVNRHLCYHYDETYLQSLARRQPQQEGEIIEVTQYPILRTQAQENDQMNNLVAVVSDIVRSRILKVNGSHDRPILLTICPSDIINVLMSSDSNGLLQTYAAIAQSYFQSPMLGFSTAPKAQPPSIVDFKPIWAIRRAMEQQIAMNLTDKRLQRVPELTTHHRKVSDMRNMRSTRTNKHEEDGENIQDEESGEMQKSMSFIKCKPSLIQSNKNGLDDTDENAMASTLHGHYSASRPGSTQAQNMSMSQIMKQKKRSTFNTGLTDGSDQNKMRLLYGGRRAREFGLSNNSILFGGNADQAENLNMTQNYFDENYLFEILYQYERTIMDACGEDEDQHQQALAIAGKTTKCIDISIKFNCPVEIQVLTTDSNVGASPQSSEFPPRNQSQAYAAASRIKLAPSEVSLQRTVHYSSFCAFGVEFESTNNLRVLHAFSKQLYDQMRSFMNHPIIEDQLRGQFAVDQLQRLISHRVYQKKKFGHVGNAVASTNNNNILGSLKAPDQSNGLISFAAAGNPHPQKKIQKTQPANAIQADIPMDSQRHNYMTDQSHGEDMRKRKMPVVPPGGSLKAPHMQQSKILPPPAVGGPLDASAIAKVPQIKKKSSMIQQNQIIAPNGYGTVNGRKLAAPSSSQFPNRRMPLQVASTHQPGPAGAVPRGELAAIAEAQGGDQDEQTTLLLDRQGNNRNYDEDDDDEDAVSNEYHANKQTHAQEMLGRSQGQVMMSPKHMGHLGASTGVSGASRKPRERSPVHGLGQSQTSFGTVGRGSQKGAAHSNRLFGIQ